MIPQRMLGNEFSHNGVRNRVTACRKRLRESRVMVRAHAAAEIEDLSPEDVHARGGVTELATDEARNSELMAEQEVGIT